MAVLEDFPELVIDIVFLTVLGTSDEELTSADIALFVFGALLSMYHIFKCIWTFVKFRSVLAAVKAMVATDVEAATKADEEVRYGF